MSNLNILFPLLGSGKSDPIAGLTSFRLQTHRGEVGHYEDAVQVSGAGETAVNGLYIDNGSIVANQSVYIKGSYAVYFDGNGHVLTLDTVIYYRNDSEDATATWRTDTGDSPAPTVTALRVPFYKPIDLYKDTTCLVPAITTSDVVLGVKDTISDLGIQATQSNSMKGPIIGFDNGVPYIDFDGIDDWLLKSGADMGGQITYSALFRSKTPTWNSYWSLLDTTILIPPGLGRWGLFDNVTTHFYVAEPTTTPAAVVKNGDSLSSPFDLNPIMDWQVITVTTAVSDMVLTRGIGALEQTNFGGFQLIALFIHDPADSAKVAAYLETLKP